MLKLKKFASPLCAVALLLSTTFVPSIASAGTVNTELANNPTAVIAEIEKIGLPLSDEMAGEVRGESFALIQLWGTNIAIWCSSNCQNTYDLLSGYWDIFSIVSAPPKGTPVYSSTANSTPMYYY